MYLLKIGSVLLLSVTAFFVGTNKNVPDVVKQSFENKYATADKIDWEFEEAEDDDVAMWEAEFYLNKEEMSASFAEDGTWLETEKEVKTKDLPSAVTAVLTNDFSDYEIDDESEWIETKEGSFYSIELEKGDTELDLEITTDGNVLKQEIETENEEK